MVKKKYKLKILLPSAMVAVIFVDLLTKSLILKYLPYEGVTAPFLGFRFHHTHNTGAAFSFFKENPGILTFFIFVILTGCVIFLCLSKKTPTSQRVCLTLICAGGICNLIDRLRFGFVIDFIEPTFFDFAIFNFADSVLTCAVAAWVVLLLRESLREKRAEKQ